MSVTPFSTPWLPYLRSGAQARLRLLCFPYAGGMSTIFRAWQDSLPTDVEVCPIELPGRGMRLMEHRFSRLLPLVEAVIQGLLPNLDKPFAVFGHSMGALLGFEMSRQLWKDYGFGPIHLFVSGHTAPQIPSADPPTHLLPTPEFLKKLRDLKGTPDHLLEHEELMKVVLPILRTDFAITETYVYRHGRPLTCPITAFGGLQDNEVSREQLEAWRQQTNSSFCLRMLPGGHFFLHTAQPQLLDLLSGALNRLLELQK